MDLNQNNLVNHNNTIILFYLHIKVITFSYLLCSKKKRKEIEASNVFKLYSEYFRSPLHISTANNIDKKALESVSFRSVWIWFK